MAVFVVAAAWWTAGSLARRVQAATLPPLADLSSLPDAARDLVVMADAAARAQPQSADSVGALGRAYHASLMSDAALELYGLAERLDHPGGRWTYARALILEEYGRQDEAIEALARVTAENPSHGLAWFRLGEMRFKQGRLDEADQAYRRAVMAPPAPVFAVPGGTTRTVTPVSAFARLGLARIAIDQQRSNEAITILDELMTAFPSFGPARALRQSLSDDARQAGRPLASAYVPPADPALDIVVAESRMRDLLLKHAALAARGDDRPWREFLVRRALEFNPDDPNVLIEMAGMLQATGRSADALVHLRRHQQIVPDDHHALVEEGRCLSDIGRYEEAEAVLRRAVRVRDAAAEYNLGSVLDRQGRSEEALDRYDRALAIDPFHTRAMNNKGVWLDRHGRNPEAIAWLERAIRAAPDNADAHSNLGSAYIGARRFADALRVLNLAIALAPEMADAHNNLGIALAQTGRLPEAVRQFETAVTLNPRHANARRNLAQVAARLTRPR
ncbi:MAG: tetratricopeptide repeat protein [Acidobacteria bacterium]|nr:tetratricopeptide repeat protein [Acidobacteriota bacterium]